MSRKKSPRNPQGKIAFKNGLGFQARVEEVHLKYCILGDACKTRLQGETFFLKKKQDLLRIAPTSHWWKIYSRTKDYDFKVRITTTFASTRKDQE